MNLLAQRVTDLANIHSLERGALKSLFALPTRLRDLTPTAPFEYEGHVVERDTRFLLQLGRLKGKSFGDMTVAEARTHYRNLCELSEAPPPSVAWVRDMQIPSPWGSIPLRQYAPSAYEHALMFFHGGGFVMGDLETHDALCRRIAADVGCLVIAVDYRLGPEARFPAAVNDAWHAYQWMVSHLPLLGVRGRVAIAGDSAGGNLAATISWLARDHTVRTPDLQVCIYPAVASVDHPGRHRNKLLQHFGLDDRSVKWFIEQYLGETRALPKDPRLAPLYVSEHGGLPEAIITTSHFDLLSLEGREYADALRASQVAVTEIRETELVHGYATMSAFPKAKEAVDRITSAIRRSLAR